MLSLLEVKLSLQRQFGPGGGRDRLILLREDPARLCEFPFVEDPLGCRYPGNLKRFSDWSVFLRWI